MLDSETPDPADASMRGEESLLAEVQNAIAKGRLWLRGRIGEDGHPGARHCHYYRVPWALALAGDRLEASAVLSWIEREALNGSGDLREEARGGFDEHWSSYPIANLASGAWHLERYDLARLLAGRLRAGYQDAETGGAYAAHPDIRSSQRQDLFPTAQLGMTGLTTGHMDLAHGAYQWISALFKAQPELPTRLYTATEGSQLVTHTGGDEDLAWQVVTDFTRPRQAFYNPGIAAAFLGRYYMATGNEQALQLACDYLELTIQGTDAQFDHDDSVQVCKFAWGASVLLEATDDPTYLRHVRRMGGWFVDAQNPDGSWDNSPFLMDRGGHVESVRVEITAEFIQHLTSVVNAIGAWPRTGRREGVRA
jgi:hypothetical protein